MAKSSRFHVGKRGKPTPCMAKVGNCPLGGETAHYASREEAQQAIEKTYAESYNILSSLDSWNPDNAKKDVSEKFKNLYNHGVLGNGDVNKGMEDLRDTIKKYEGVPETLVDLHKRFVTSKTYMQDLEAAKKPDATILDKERFNIVRQAALSMVQPVSNNLQNKKEFNSSKIGLYGAVPIDKPEKGSKEWFKQKHDKISGEDVAIIYENKYGSPDDKSNQAYLNLVKDKSTFYTEDDYQKMEDDYKEKERNGENIVLNANEVMKPIIAKDFAARDSNLEVLQDNRYFQGEDSHQQVEIAGLYREKDDSYYKESVENDEFSGAVITSASGSWGKNMPPKERAKALYIADTLAVSDVKIVNRANLNEDNDYIVNEEDPIDPKAKEKMYFSDFKDEINEFNALMKSNRNQDKISKGIVEN